VDGRSKSSHDSKIFRTISMEKQKGMAFGFRKTATAVKNTGQAGRQAGRQMIDRYLLTAWSRVLLEKLTSKLCS